MSQLGHDNLSCNSVSLKALQYPKILNESFKSLLTKSDLKPLVRPSLGFSSPRLPTLEEAKLHRLRRSVIVTALYPHTTAFPKKGIFDYNGFFDGNLIIGSSKKKTANVRTACYDHLNFNETMINNTSKSSSEDEQLFISIYNKSFELLNKYNNENLIFKKEEKSRICDFVEKNKNDILNLIEECQDYLSTQSFSIVNFQRKEVLFCLKQKTFFLKLYISAGQMQGANFLSYFYLIFRKEVSFECSEMFTDLLFSLKEMISTKSIINLLRNSIFVFYKMFTLEKMTKRTNLTVSLVDQKSIDSLTHECLKNFIQIFLLFKQACLNVDTKSLLLEEEILLKNILKENTLESIYSFLMDLEDSLNLQEPPKGPPNGKASDSVPKLLNGHEQNEKDSDNSTKFQILEERKKKTFVTSAVQFLTGGILISVALLGKAKIIREMGNLPLSGFSNATVYAACPPFAAMRFPNTVSNPNASPPNQENRRGVAVVPSLPNQAQSIANPGNDLGAGSSRSGFWGEPVNAGVPVPEQAQITSGVSRQTTLGTQALMRHKNHTLNYKSLVIILYEPSLPNFIYYHPYSNSCLVTSPWTDATKELVDNEVNEWIFGPCQVFEPYYCFVNLNDTQSKTQLVETKRLYVPFGIFGYGEEPTKLIVAAAKHFKDNLLNQLPTVAYGEGINKQNMSYFQRLFQPKFGSTVISFLSLSNPVTSTSLELCHRIPFRIEQLFFPNSNIANQRAQDGVKTVYAAKKVNALSDQEELWCLTKEITSLYDFVDKGTQVFLENLPTVSNAELGLPLNAPPVLRKKFEHDIITFFKQQRTVAFNKIVYDIAAIYPTMFPNQLTTDIPGGAFRLTPQQNSFILKTMLAYKLKHVFNSQLQSAMTHIAGNSFSNAVELFKTLQEKFQEEKFQANFSQNPTVLGNYLYMVHDTFGQVIQEIDALQEKIDQNLKKALVVLNVMEPAVASLLDDLELSKPQNTVNHSLNNQIQEDLIKGIAKEILEFKLNQASLTRQIKNMHALMSQFDGFIENLNNEGSKELKKQLTTIHTQFATLNDSLIVFETSESLLIKNPTKLPEHYNNDKFCSFKKLDNLLYLAQQFQVNSLKAEKAKTRKSVAQNVRGNPSGSAPENTGKYALKNDTSLYNADDPAGRFEALQLEKGDGFPTFNEQHKARNIQAKSAGPSSGPRPLLPPSSNSGANSSNSGAGSSNSGAGPSSKQANSGGYPTRYPTGAPKPWEQKK